MREEDFTVRNTCKRDGKARALHREAKESVLMLSRPNPGVKTILNIFCADTYATFQVYLVTAGLISYVSNLKCQHIYFTVIYPIAIDLLTNECYLHFNLLFSNVSFSIQNGGKISASSGQQDISQLSLWDLITT